MCLYIPFLLIQNSLELQNSHCLQWVLIYAKSIIWLPPKSLIITTLRKNQRFLMALKGCWVEQRKGIKPYFHKLKTQGLKKKDLILYLLWIKITKGRYSEHETKSDVHFCCFHVHNYPGNTDVFLCTSEVLILQRSS